MKPGALFAFAVVALAVWPASGESARKISGLPKGAEERALDRPKGIGSSERVAGIWASPPRRFRPRPGANGPGNSVVVAPAPLSIDVGREAATSLTLGLGSLDASADACIQTSSNGVSWSAPSANSAALLERVPSDITVVPPQTTRETVVEDVWLIRAERFVAGSGEKASLERIDAWVDLRTGGVREAARGTVNLSLVQRLSGGLAVYGARQENRVTFVVRPARVRLVVDGAPPAPIVVLDTGEGTQGHCGHRTVTLSADKAGQSATEILTGEVSVPVETSSESKALQTYKARSFRLLLTETWSSGEAEPAIGASFGWSGTSREDGRQWAVATASPPRPQRPHPPRMR